MTHFRDDFFKDISWDDCEIVRQQTNNTIVLRFKSQTIMLLSGEDIGVGKYDSTLAIDRATPIFKAALSWRNRAFEKGNHVGSNTAKAGIRMALGL